MEKCRDCPLIRRPKPWRIRTVTQGWPEHDPDVSSWAWKPASLFLTRRCPCFRLWPWQRLPVSFRSPSPRPWPTSTISNRGMSWNGSLLETSFGLCLPMSPKSGFRRSIGFGCSIRLPIGNVRATGRFVSPLTLPPEDGPARTCILVAVLVDTNILVYRFDYRYPDKQRRATALLREGIQSERLRLPHQAIIEFVAAVTRPLAGGLTLLTSEEACRETEDLLAQFPILYPTEGVLRSALRGAAAYHLSWFDAHLWAYADHYGLEEIVSEDFQHDRLYGSVRIRNPFL